MPKANDIKLNVIIMGLPAAGKLALVDKVKNMRQKINDDVDALWQPYNIADSKDYDNLPIRCHAAVVVVDTTVALEQQEADIKKLIGAFKKNCPNVPLFLVANKCDTQGILQKIRESAFMAFAEELCESGELVTPFYGVSGRDNTKVTELFAALTKEVISPKSSKDRKDVSDAWGTKLVAYLVALGIVGGLVLFFTAPWFLIPLTSMAIGALGIPTFFIASTGIAASILFGTFALVVSSQKKSEALYLIISTIGLSGFLGIVAAGLLFGAAPALGALITATLGVPMTIISITIAALLVSSMANLVGYLLSSSSMVHVAKREIDMPSVRFSLVGVTLDSSLFKEKIVPFLVQMGAAFFVTAIPFAALFSAMIVAAPLFTGVPLLFGGHLALNLVFLIVTPIVMGVIGAAGSWVLKQALNRSEVLSAESKGIGSENSGVVIRYDRLAEPSELLSTPPKLTDGTRKKWSPGLYSEQKEEKTDISTKDNQENISKNAK